MMINEGWPTLLNQSKYTNRLPIGTDEVLNHFKPAALASFYHTWYRPDLQALIVVGDIDVDKMERVIKAKFSDLKNPAPETARTRYSVPLNTKNQFMVVTDMEMTETDAGIVIKHPAFSLATTADYRQMIINQLFNQMLSGRLAWLSRRSAMPFIEARAKNQSFLGGLDSYNVSVESKPGELENSFKAVWRESERITLNVSFGCAPENADKLIDSTLSEINRLRTEGPSQLNVDKFKAEDQRTTEKIQLKTNNFWLSYLNGQLQNKEPLDQIIDDYHTEMDRITPDALKSIAEKYLTGKNIIRLVLKPAIMSK